MNSATTNPYASSEAAAMTATYADIWLVAGARTPFADYNSALRDVSPTDLGIYAARALLEKSGIPAAEINAIVAGNMAQASFDAYFLPRHIGLYSGVNPNAPALLVQRLCGTGFETIVTAANQGASMVALIATAAEEQAQVVSEAANGVDRVATLSSTTVDDSRGISATADGIRAECTR